MKKRIIRYVTTMLCIGILFACSSNYVTINEQHKPHSKIGSGVIYMQIKNSHHYGQSTDGSVLPPSIYVGESLARKNPIQLVRCIY